MTETPTGRRPRRSGLSIQSMLLIMLLLVSILSNVVVGIIGYVNGNESLRAAAIDQEPLRSRPLGWRPLG